MHAVVAVDVRERWRGRGCSDVVLINVSIRAN